WRTRWTHPATTPRPAPRGRARTCAPTATAAAAWRGANARPAWARERSSRASAAA
ncbi:MAG: Chaperone protein DnaJ, partial [uncultured Sphingomonadaceae bacterium]